MPKNDESKAWRRYVQHFRKDSLRKILGSRACVMTYEGDPTDDFDVEQAAQLGAILLTGRPLIILVTPGSTIPEGLRRAASELVEIGDIHDPVNQDRILEATRRVVPEVGR